MEFAKFVVKSITVSTEFDSAVKMGIGVAHTYSVMVLWISYHFVQNHEHVLTDFGYLWE